MPYAPFAAHLAGRGLAERSITEYVRVIARAERWIVDHHRVPLVEAVPAHVRDWSDTLRPSWSTRKQARTAIAHWQGWALHPEDLAAAIRVPRKPKMRPRALSDSDAAKLERAAHTAGRPGLAVLLGLYLGMRRTEIARATWTSWDRAANEWVWQRAKTGDIARLPIHPRLAAALAHVSQVGPYVFPGHLGRGRAHAAPVTIWEWVRDVGASVGVEVTVHQLRHTSISRVVDTMGLRVGQEWAGHRDPEVTAGYSMVPVRKLSEAMGQLSWGDDEDDPPAPVMAAA